MHFLVASTHFSMLTSAPQPLHVLLSFPIFGRSARGPSHPRGRCRSCSFVSPSMSQKEIDHAIRTTFRNPPILASEDRAQYADLKRLVLSDIKPRGLQETLLARDIVEAEWEVCRL